MRIPVKDKEKLAAAMKSCASDNAPEREKAQRAFAAELSAPIRKAVFDESNHAGIFESDVLQPGATPNYPLDFVAPGTEDDYIAYVMPAQARVPERHVEGDELWVPTYKIANSIDWDIDYMRNARFDVVMRAMEVYKAGFVRKNNIDAWRTLLAAADDRGTIVTASGSAPFTGNTSLLSPPTEGAFVKELIARAQTAMSRGAGGNSMSAGKLTDLYLSVEALEDIRAWGLTQVDDVTRKEILNAATPLPRIYGVTLHPMTEFGQGQEYQMFLTDVLSASLPASCLEFCVGLDLSQTDSFVNPIRQELETFEDPALHRQQRMGVYGWANHGWAVLDARRVLLCAF